MLKKQNKMDELSQVESKLQSLKPGPVAKSEAENPAAPASVDAPKAEAVDAMKVDTKPVDASVPAVKADDTKSGDSKAVAK